MNPKMKEVPPMKNPKDDPKRMICGMTEPTAKRYINMRKELDAIIARVHKAGYWLSEFDKANPAGMTNTLTLMGLTIMHEMAQIHHCLETDFVSLARIYDAFNGRKK
jgi:hypothetical protein